MITLQLVSIDMGSAGAGASGPGSGPIPNNLHEITAASVATDDERSLVQCASQSASGTAGQHSSTERALQTFSQPHVL